MLLRLAEDLERCRDQAVREAHLEPGDDGLRLTLVTDGEAAVPRWAAAREVDAFERAFGRTLVVA